MAHVEDRWHHADGTPTDLYQRCIRWRVRWRLPDGRHRSRSFDRRSDAARYARDLESRGEQGESLDPARGRITVGEWGTGWLATMRPPITKPKTYATYESLMRTKIMPRWGGTPLNAVTNADVRGWIADLGADSLSPSTIRKAYFLFAEVMEAAVVDDRLTRNRARDVKLPRLPHKPRNRYLSHEEVTKLWQVSGHPLIPFLAYTGLRWAEAVALEPRDLDLDRRRVHVERTLSDVNGHFHLTDTKNHKAREVPLPATLIAILEPLPSRGLVFPSTRGTPLRASNFQRSVLTPALAATGIPHLSPHALRHTAASLAVQAGANVLAVARMLGHQDPSITLKDYADLFDSDLDRVAGQLDEQIAASRLRPENLRLVT